MPVRKCPLIACLFLFAILSQDIARAAEVTESSSWSYRAWQTDEGLPDNSVTGVEQTSDGYLWVATYGGLLRFNGARFSAIPQAGVVKKSVRAMLLDHLGRLWLGMDSGSVVCLESNSTRNFTGGDGLPAERIACMAEDREGAVWIAYSTTICRIKDGQVRMFTSTEGLPTGANGWLTTDAKGEMWFTKGGQVGVFRDDKLFPKKLAFKETAVRICRASPSGLWICAGPRLFKYEENSEPQELMQLPPNAEPQVLFEDHAGALWIGTAADGLFRFNGGELETVPTSHQSVNCLSQDREGNIWAGTRGGGLNLIRPSAIKVIAREAGLPFESVASVCEDSDGIVWVVSQSGTLTRYLAGKWNVVGAQDGWTNEGATCVAADRKSGVWVGSRNRTLSYFHDGTWRTWQRQDGLHSGSVHLIFVTTGNDVWVVSGSPSRLQLVRQEKVFPPLELPGENRTVRAMAEGSDGSLWVGTFEGQILRIKDGALVRESVASEKQGSPVRSLETSDGALWIGYAGAGLGRLKDGKYSHITSANGLRDDFPSQLLADGRGGLWIVGNRGLFQVPLKELDAVADGRADRLRSVVFGRNEGLPNFQPNSANFPNVCKSANGRLWFALRSGLLTLQPQQIHDNPVPPPVVLERIAVDDKAVSLYDGGSPFRTEGGDALPDLRASSSVLRIPPGHRKVDFEFAALSFASPENVEFRYRLENFDDKWIDPDGQRIAKYQNLQAGNYRFHVIACNNAGVWNENGAVLDITVWPFFWQTFWFRALVVLVFTLSIVACVRYVSFRRLRERMLQLERQTALERERARIARDMHDEVGAKLTRLSLLSEMASVENKTPESVRDEVREISDTARETIRSFEEIVWAVNPRKDTLADLVHYLCRYAEDFFDGTPVQCAFDLPPEIPSAALITEVRHHVFLAAKEAMNNVLKHADAGTVRVKLTFAPAEFRITIEDDGKGFDTANPPKRAGGGNGMENMRERIASVSGKFECVSSPGEGTRVIFTVPCPIPQA